MILRSNQPLFVIHHRTTCPGLLGQLATKWYGGYQTISAPEGGFPDPSEIHAPVIVMGGLMSSNDPSPQVKAELAWIEQLMGKNKSILGICLGAQMMAKVLGQQIGPCPDGFLECGYVPLVRHEAHLPSHVYQWHREGMVWDQHRTPEAKVLATSQWRNGACQAFQVGSSLGLQFHPEVTLDRIQYWTQRDAEDLVKPGARPPQTHLEDHVRYGDAVNAWMTDYLHQLWQVKQSNEAHPSSCLPINLNLSVA